MLNLNLHWVTGIDPHRIALTPCPLGRSSLPDQIAGWRANGVDSVVSLLETHEAKLRGVENEGRECESRGIHFRSFPIPDHGTPESQRELTDLVESLHSDLFRGKTLLIHCFAAIGRTGIVAACLLHILKIPEGEIFHLLRTSRGFDMPGTSKQVEWVKKYIRDCSPAL